MRYGKIYFLLVPAVCLALLSCGNENGEYDATGYFEATEIIVSSQANGQIVSLDIDEGAILNAGDQVGLIDTTQLFLQKMNLIANVAGVRVQQPNIDRQTAAIKEQIESLRRERDRTKKLLDANVANKKQLDDIESQIEVLEKQLIAQTSSLQKSSANITAQSSALDIRIAQIEDNLKKCYITSPVDGTVLVQYAQKGELATFGTPLFKIADLSRLYLRAYITYDQLSQIKLNDTVTVKTDYGKSDSRSYKGTINYISDKSEFTPKTIRTKNERANLVYAITVAVINDGYLKIGMYGEVQF